MPATTPERHHDISAMFMEHAEDQFRQGDLLQASEKAWGAVAHCISAIARESDGLSEHTGTWLLMPKSLSHGMPHKPSADIGSGMRSSCCTSISTRR